LQQPGDEQDDGDAGDARERDAGLVVEVCDERN
jgi:hypothetical protein